MPQVSQQQMFYQASRANAELNIQFLQFVREGLTREELQRNIDRRPALWGRWRSWLSSLPCSSQKTTH